MSAKPISVLRWPGSKWRMARWIVANFPPHLIYLEPYAGSAAVLFTKPRSKIEIINDRDGQVINLHRVLRDQPAALAEAVRLTPYARSEYDACWSEPATGDPLEDARRFLVRVWMCYGLRLAHDAGWAIAVTTAGTSRALDWAGLDARILAMTERLRGVYIECRPALNLIGRFATPECLLYVDPPYPLETRVQRQEAYAHEMTGPDHEELLGALEQHPGPVMLSGYRCPLYDERLAAWQRLDKQSWTQSSRVCTESLWLSPRAIELQRGHIQQHLPAFPFGCAQGDEARREGI